MVLVAVLAHEHVAGLLRVRRRAAAATEPVGPRPVGQRRGVGDDAELLAGQRRRQIAQAGERDALALDAEDRSVRAEAQERRVGVGLGERDGLRVRAVAADDDRPRAGIAARRLQPGLVGAQMGGAIERAAGEGDGVR
jgi:hypothetical protein